MDNSGDVLLFLLLLSPGFSFAVDPIADQILAMVSTAAVSIVSLSVAVMALLVIPHLFRWAKRALDGGPAMTDQERAWAYIDERQRNIDDERDAELAGETDGSDEDKTADEDEQERSAQEGIAGELDAERERYEFSQGGPDSDEEEKTLGGWQGDLDAGKYQVAANDEDGGGGDDDPPGDSANDSDGAEDEGERDAA